MVLIIVASSVLERGSIVTVITDFSSNEQVEWEDTTPVKQNDYWSIKWFHIVWPCIETIFRSCNWILARRPYTGHVTILSPKKIFWQKIEKRKRKVYLPIRHIPRVWSLLVINSWKPVLALVLCPWLEGSEPVSIKVNREDITSIGAMSISSNKSH